MDFTYLSGLFSKTVNLKRSKNTSYIKKLLIFGLFGKIWTFARASIKKHRYGGFPPSAETIRFFKAMNLKLWLFFFKKCKILSSKIFKSNHELMLNLIKPSNNQISTKNEISKFCLRSTYFNFRNGCSISNIHIGASLLSHPVTQSSSDPVIHCFSHPATQSSSNSVIQWLSHPVTQSSSDSVIQWLSHPEYPVLLPSSQLPKNLWSLSYCSISESSDKRF